MTRYVYECVGTLAGVLCCAGCAGSITGHAGPTHLASADKAVVFDAAQTVLRGMLFSLEKADLEQGFIRTHPLPGAQFFEVWRSDNAGFTSHLEANVQSLRRVVEMSVAQEPDGVRLDCRVIVQRFSVPGREAASTGQVYQVVTASDASHQGLRLAPDQAGQWVDLGPDPALARRITERIKDRIGSGQKGEAEHK